MSDIKDTKISIRFFMFELSFQLIFFMQFWCIFALFNIVTLKILNLILNTTHLPTSVVSRKSQNLGLYV